jgi:hypothetical protein
MNDIRDYEFGMTNFRDCNERAEYFVQKGEEGGISQFIQQRRWCECLWTNDNTGSLLSKLFFSYDLWKMFNKDHFHEGC